MKDPAFLFYPNDWIGGTMGMTFEEKGAYMELLMMQFNQGHMTTHMIGHTVGQIWDKIQHKFVKDESGKWYNVRLELEQKKRKEFTNSRKNNLNGNNQYKKNGGHMSNHMENENEDNKSTYNYAGYLCTRKMPESLKGDNKLRWLLKNCDKAKTDYVCAQDSERITTEEQKRGEYRIFYNQETLDFKYNMLK